MSPVFKIEAIAEEPRTWQSKHGGEFIRYTVNVSGGDAFQGEAVELTRKPESAPPQIGEELTDYELMPKKGTFPRKLKRMKQGGNVMHVPMPNPEQRAEQQEAYEASQRSRQAEIRCSVAIKAAVGLLQSEVAAGKTFEGQTAQALLGPRVKFFEDIIRKAGEGA